MVSPAAAHNLSTARSRHDESRCGVQRRSMPVLNTDPGARRSREGHSRPLAQRQARVSGPRQSDESRTTRRSMRTGRETQ
jgi:hypothetical protein